MEKGLIITQGLPASGKSTWAKEFVKANLSYVRVCRDDLRNMRGIYWLPEQEDMITEWEMNCVHDAIMAGKNVVVDATNFNRKAIDKFKTKASKFGMVFTIKAFDTPLEECIKRDNERTVGKVGEKVIRDMYNKYLATQPSFTPVKQDRKLPAAIICDLDGTVALHNGRNPFEYMKCYTDKVNEPVAEIVKRIAETHTIIFVSGREDMCYEMTKQWLTENRLFFHDSILLMRKTGDNRSDDIVKKEIFDANIGGKYCVDFVLDDRNKVVRMWRQIGLICLQVAEGDF